MNTNDFIRMAKTNNWTRKQAKHEIFKLGGEELWAQREEILSSLGLEAKPQPVVAAQSVATIAAVAQKAKTRKYANQYAGTCELTGQLVAAGDGVCLRFGSSWCVLGPLALSVCVCDGDERKLLSAAMIAGGGETLELDHEDITMLRELLAACDRDNVLPGCWADSL